MTKQEFIIIVKAIKDTYKEEMKIDDVIYKLSIFENAMITFSELPCFKALEALLKMEFNKDQLDLIYWWIYETVEKVLLDEKTGEVVKRLDTLEELYDYLKEEF